MKCTRTPLITPCAKHFLLQSPKATAQIVYVPVTVMSNEHVPSFIAVSLALHVTVVVLSGKESPDDTALPELSVHAVTGRGPLTTSSADGIGDHVTGVLVAP